MAAEIPHTVIRRSQKFKITGKAKIIGWDAKIVPDYRTSLILQNNPFYYEHLLKKAIQYYDNKTNLVVNGGVAQLIDLMIAVSAATFTHCGVGSSATGAAAGQTDLVTPISRLAVTSRYRAGSVEAHFDTFFSTADGNGTWNESGIFTAIAAGIMLCRRVLTTPFTKSSSNTATIAWTITFTPV